MPVTEYWEAMRRSGMTRKTNDELQNEVSEQPVAGTVGGLE